MTSPDHALEAAAPKLTLLDFPPCGQAGWESFSPFVMQVSRALHFAKLPFEHKHLPLLKLPTATPHGQLPVLCIGEEAVTDSTCILQRIDSELAPGSLSAGLDARTQAEAWLWEEYADTALYPYALATRWADQRHWPGMRDVMFRAVPAPLRLMLAGFIRRGILSTLVGRDFTRTGLDACYARMERMLDALEARAPAEGFWLADRVTAADLGLFAQLHSLRAPFAPVAASAVAARPRLSAYLDRVDLATR